MGIKGKSQDPSEKVSMLLEAMRPKRLAFAGAGGRRVKIVRVCCGNTQAAAIDQFGELFAWGERYMVVFL